VCSTINEIFLDSNAKSASLSKLQLLPDVEKGEEPSNKNNLTKIFYNIFKKLIMDIRKKI
jgi:hypothetical protein